MAKLSDRERTLLQQYYIDGLGVVELGALHGIAQSTVSRTLAKARIVVTSELHRILGRTTKIGGSDLDDLVELARSQLSLAGLGRSKSRA